MLRAGSRPKALRQSSRSDPWIADAQARAARRQYIAQLSGAERAELAHFAQFAVATGSKVLGAAVAAAVARMPRRDRPVSVTAIASVLVGAESARRPDIIGAHRASGRTGEAILDSAQVGSSSSAAERHRLAKTRVVAWIFEIEELTRFTA